MDVWKAIRLSLTGQYDGSIEIGHWDGEDDTLHFEFPEGTKIVLDAKGQIFYLLLPNQTKIFMHLGHLEKVDYDKLDKD